MYVICQYVNVLDFVDKVNSVFYVIVSVDVNVLSYYFVNVFGEFVSGWTLVVDNGVDGSIAFVDFIQICIYCNGNYG